MAKSLRSYPEEQRKSVALARIEHVKRSKEAILGLGYWAAVDYLAKKGI